MDCDKEHPSWQLAGLLHALPWGSVDLVHCLLECTTMLTPPGQQCTAWAICHILQFHCDSMQCHWQDSELLPWGFYLASEGVRHKYNPQRKQHSSARCGALH